MRKVLVVGATSAIAEAAARLLAARGDRLHLVGRNAARLDAIAADLRVRSGAAVTTDVLDADDLARHPAVIERAATALEGLDAVLIAHGTLPDQAACERSVEQAVREIHTNAISVVSLATLVANRLEAQGGGTLAVITSVAGDRGRSSNYVYGSAKALVTTFLSGLRQRLARSKVHVVTVKPGFVDTPMTAAFRKGALWAKPEQVASGIVRAMDRGTPVVYLPWFWRWIMTIIVHVPERVFARLRF